MRKLAQIVLPAVVAAVVFMFANTAQAGEPFHPIYQPVFNFFSGLFGGF